MIDRASIFDILRKGLEATKKNANTVVPLYVGIQAVIFVLSYTISSIMNLLMIPVILFMQISLLKSYKSPITKFDPNVILDLKDSSLKPTLWKLFTTYAIYTVLLTLLFLPSIFVFVLFYRQTYFNPLLLLSLPLAIPGIIFMIYWYVFSFIVLDQGISGMAVLKKNRQMVKGRFWETFALLAIWAVLCVISSSVITAVTAGNQFFAGIFMAVVSGLITVYFGYVGVAYYLHLKK